ncbi:MAG: imidazoleglycerol-phosphate dehydratase HisB [Spirochaetales bacterium]
MSVTIDRNTKETRIHLVLDLDSSGAPKLATGLPFFDHMLNALAFHGGFFLEVTATGDLDVDPHHLVEDVGIVLGDAFSRLQKDRGALVRYGHQTIPMDEALSECVIDVCSRPYWVYEAELPQTHAGNFDLSLVREFVIALANNARITLHARCRYGENAHHMVEALFKALGKALAQAYTLRAPGSVVPSTKGVL